MRRLKICAAFCVWVMCIAPSFGALRQDVVDIPTREGVVVRAILLSPDAPKANLILFAGGHGGLHISKSGALGYGDTIFLIRNREQLANAGITVAVVDAPSDR